MASSNSTIAPPRTLSRELTLTRTFDAPRGIVYRAWTDAAHVANWWVPGPGFTVPVCEIDPRPGGALRIDMRGPDGIVFTNAGTFFEALEPERLVHTLNYLDEAGHAVIANLNTITLEERAGRTTLTLHARAIHVAPDAMMALATSFQPVK